MGFLEAIRQAVSGNPGGRSRGGAERLNLKVVRLFEEGRFREATEAARQLLEVQRQELGEAHPDYATALSNLALLLQRQGDLDEAEPLLRQALAVRETLFGGSHPDCATTLNNLGELLSLRGDLGGAETLLRRALAIRKELLGESHPDYAISLSSLALLLNKRGDPAGAESLLRQSLDVRREMLGEFDPDYAAGLSNLALLLFARGDLPQAEAMLRQALDIRRAAQGEHHPDYVATSNSLSRLLRRRAEQARPDATPPPTEPPRVQAPTDARPSTPAETGTDPRPARRDDEMAGEAALLTDLFAEAGNRLCEAGRRMGSDGVFPGADVFRTLAACHLRLSALRAEVRQRAESLGIPCPPPESTDGLREVRSLLEAVGRVTAEASRSRAQAILDQVLRLRTRDDGETGLSALHECQADARELHDILSASPPGQPLPVVDQLNAGGHPFACLLALVGHPGSPDDRQRTDHHRTVAWAYGPSLADGAARGRLFLSPEAGALHPAGGAAGDLVDPGS